MSINALETALRNRILNSACHDTCHNLKTESILRFSCLWYHAIRAARPQRIPLALGSLPYSQNWDQDAMTNPELAATPTLFCWLAVRTNFLGAYNPYNTGGAKFNFSEGFRNQTRLRYDRQRCFNSSGATISFCRDLLICCRTAAESPPRF